MNSYNDDTVIIIMAGGLGKRMNSSIPKVLHFINNKPMIIHVVETALKLNPHKICIVVGKFFNEIQKTIEQTLCSKMPDIRKKIEYVIQDNPLGTGHAVLCCKNNLESTINVNKIVVLSGDVPLITYNTLYKLINALSSVNILISNIDEPYGYGRIVLENNKIIKIIEEKDCSEDNKKINLINSGIYAFDKTVLLKYIDKLDNNNSQKEFYLTQIFEFINQDKLDINYIIVENNNEILGVNNIEQLTNLNKII
jgi:UDP-N-acetylglucosamine diphosphorylase/glucosamine-1-phosphate N-acetyltransferase